MFLGPAINLKLRPRILDLKPGTRIVSNTFTMGEWEPDQSRSVEGKEGCSSYCTALLWIVPAHVGAHLEISSRRPDVQAELSDIFRNAHIQRHDPARHEWQTEEGDLITFSAGGVDYSGRVSGSTIQGTLTSAVSTAPWNATRLSSPI